MVTKYKALEIKTQKIWNVTRLDFDNDGNLTFIWCKGSVIDFLIEQTCGDPSEFELKQFIGEVDKNGRDIYEGDFVSFIGSVEDNSKEAYAAGFGGEVYYKQKTERVIFENGEFHANHFDYDSTPDWKDMEVVP